MIVLLTLLCSMNAFAEKTEMNSRDFTVFTRVTLTGIDIDALDADERSVLHQAARYCQAMTEADIDTMRGIVSEDMTFTHMSGRTQTREEYFADVADGSLTYYAIGMKDPVVEVDGDTAMVTYTAALTADAYGARGTFRMKGTHWYQRIDGEWIAVNRPE
ncbi:MAG: nuclear transport factor 2 family protein [Clostridia bacterium]|nr:nuclear transport factor 2 family protein [Clostridia bacterium]